MQFSICFFQKHVEYVKKYVKTKYVVYVKRNYSLSAVDGTTEANIIQNLKEIRKNNISTQKMLFRNNRYIL